MGDTVKLVPTAEGYRRMVTMFRTDARKARENAEACEALTERVEGAGGERMRLSYEECALLVSALEHYAHHEEDRAARLEDGAVEAEKGAANG